MGIMDTNWPIRNVYTNIAQSKPDISPCLQGISIKIKGIFIVSERRYVLWPVKDPVYGLGWWRSIDILNVGIVKNDVYTLKSTNVYKDFYIGYIKRIYLSYLRINNFYFYRGLYDRKIDSFNELTTISANRIYPVYEPD